ncbi:MAG TPA: hypothetical protein VFQ99_05015 [Gallionella sp.]|nr:hypothetical protein [Gallionella sp.]
MKKHNISRYLFFYLIMFGAIEGCQLGYTLDKKETQITQHKQKIFVEISLTDLEAKHIAAPQSFGVASYPTNLQDSKLLDYIDKKIKTEGVCNGEYVLEVGFWDHGNYTIVGKCMGVAN